jgi:hypothetical protein
MPDLGISEQFGCPGILCSGLNSYISSSFLILAVVSQVSVIAMIVDRFPEQTWFERPNNNWSSVSLKKTSWRVLRSLSEQK